MSAIWVSVMRLGNLQLECGLLASPQPRVPVFSSGLLAILKSALKSGFKWRRITSYNPQRL